MSQLTTHPDDILISYSHPLRAEWVERILAGAKVDRRGVYWPTPARLRASAASLDITLAYGDAGILLALAQVYAAAPADEVREILVRGTARLRERLRETGFRHGFYGGTGGAWFLFSALEAVLPELVTGWREEAREQAGDASWEGDLPGSLLHGVAGTLVGLRLLKEGRTVPDQASSAWAALLAGAKPHPDGVFWDFNPTSFQPPVGLLGGGAGIDLVLARLQAEAGLSAPALLGGSLRYARGRFDPAVQNWPDQDASRAFETLDLAELQEGIANGRADEWTARAQPEDAIGWAAGTLGILQSRAFVMKAWEGTDLATLAREDCDRAIVRLAVVTPTALRQLDRSLFHGLSGLALGLRACRRLLPAEAFEPLARLSDAVPGALARAGHAAPADEEDLSLFSGVAGLLYADQALASPQVEDCVGVLTAPPADAPGEAPPASSLAPFLDRRLPLTSMHPPVREALQRLATLSLETVREVVRSGDDPEAEGSPYRQAREHEWSLYADLAACRFQTLLWREVSRGQTFAAKFDEGMDATLLGARLQLAPEARLVVLDFDPYARPFTGEPGTVHILRKPTSTGVIEIRLTALQHALLAAFRAPSPALAVIADVVERIDQPGVSQRQLAEFAKNVLRSFLQAGYLTSVPTRPLRLWLDARRTRAARARLFPQDTP